MKTSFLPVLCRLKYHVTVFYTFILWLLPLHLHANEIPSVFRTLTTEEGLSNNIVNVIYKDSAGYIWLGTLAGLNRFDGNDIHSYKSLESEVIYALLETDPENLYLGTENGLIRLNRATEETDTIRLETKSQIVRALYRTNDRRIFAGTDNGLFLINGKESKKVPFENGISPSNKIQAILAQNDRIYWFASSDGLCSYDIHSQTTQVYRDKWLESGRNNFTSLVICDSVLYIGTYNKGVISFDIITKTFRHLPELGSDYVLNISCDKDKNLYVGTNGSGLKIYSLKTKKLNVLSHAPEESHSVGSNTIYSFLLDNDYTFWVGTFMKGFSYNPGQRDNFHIYRYGKYSTQSDNIRSVYITGQGDKLIGTRLGLVYVSERKNSIRRISRETPGSALRSDIILHLFPVNGKIWVGTYGGGMYIFDPETVTLSEPENAELSGIGCFFRFDRDKNNRLWMGTDEGVLCYDPETKQVKKYDVSNSGLPNNNVTYLTCDSRNRIWLSTLDGLCVFDQSTGIIRTDIFSKDIASTLKKVNYVLEDYDGNLWICKARGLLKVDPSLNRTTALFDDNVFICGYEMQPEELWFATSKGVFIYSTNASSGELYPVMEGLTSVDFSNVIQKTSDSVLWLPSGKGLFYCLPKDMKALHRKGRPVITAFLVNQKPLEISEKYPVSVAYLSKLVLPSTAKNIGFRFSLLTYSPPKSEFYEYMLEGYDTGWQSLIGKNEVSYLNLSPGNYTFRLRDPFEPANEKAFQVTIGRSFIPFLLLGIGLLLMIVFSYFYWRRKKKKHRYLQQQLTMPDKNEEQDRKAKYSYVRMSEEDAMKLEAKLLDYMKTAKPYIQTNLKLSDLATNLSCSIQELSQLFSSRLNTNFTDFVNTYRVNEFKSKLKKDTSSKYTLAGLSEQSGFNSRVTFYRAFKRVTGITPQEYATNKGILLKPEGETD